ncbi:MAG: YggS family pyridoxal phosphate-dependent enzyme [Anaerolineaceae bacterium]|jgi:pyridoxal phosphate enzyme (YggS family)|nr:YggS family pyridoxal phosphate-dependent enzyme [Anaerolineaceae bacterium]
MNDIEQSLQIKENLEVIQQQIAAAANRGGWNAGDVKLVTVSKKKSVEVIQAAIQAGIRLFGENYPEETVEKMDILDREYPELAWHMIGHLQSRKVRLVAERFDMMHSLDSVRLANKLGRSLEQAGRQLPVLLEMNVSGEESKGGWSAWEEKQWEGLIPEIEQILAIDNLVVKGLMTMPPLCEDVEKTRPYFVRLRKLQEWLGRKFPETVWDELSMGTSMDFEVAVEEGATFVRIGTAILGARAY